MGIAAHIARLRAVVGHDLLLLPSVSVLPVDEAGRVLLVRHAGHGDGWGVLGGAVDVGESPSSAGVLLPPGLRGAEVPLPEVKKIRPGLSDMRPPPPCQMPPCGLASGECASSLHSVADFPWFATSTPEMKPR